MENFKKITKQQSPARTIAFGFAVLIFIGAALVVTGFLLFACDLVRKGRKTERNATVLDVLVVGVGQAIATMPGISRSGMTITTGCFMGFERKFAVRFSFLLSIPAVLGANILSLKDAIEAGINWAEVPMYLVGVITAAVVGYACIRLLRMVAEKGRFGAFAYYCWAAGLLTLGAAVLIIAGTVKKRRAEREARERL